MSLSFALFGASVGPKSLRHLGRDFIEPVPLNDQPIIGRELVGAPDDRQDNIEVRLRS